MTCLHIKFQAKENMIQQQLLQLQNEACIG